MNLLAKDLVCARNWGIHGFVEATWDACSLTLAMWGIEKSAADVGSLFLRLLGSTIALRTN